MTREEILNEIRRTAAENGGKPLGRERFERVTGISEYELNKHWPRYGDAQREAGFEPNTLNAAHDEGFVMDQFVYLTRKLGHAPTGREMKVERASNRSFPVHTVYSRLGSKNEVLGKVLDYCRERPEDEDVVPLLVSAYVPTTGGADADSGARVEGEGVGFVYLVKGHAGEYKIGRTNLVDRRLSELGATSSVEQQLIHEIKSDDPVGVEAYWHGRFADKRMRGEWFRLSAADVKAFKRWRRIY